jgi:hypothetical protein
MLKLGGARSNCGPDGAISGEVAIQSVYRGVKNEVAIGAAFEMMFNLGPHAFRQATL